MNGNSFFYICFCPMKKFFLYLMSLIYIAAGINHFRSPAYYLTIMPFYLPYPRELVYISGACVIIFGLLLIPELTRRIAAWLIIILLIAIFPANLEMTINFYHENNPQLWLTLLRLPLQIALIWWAWKYTKRLNISKNQKNSQV